MPRAHTGPARHVLAHVTRTLADERASAAGPRIRHCPASIAALSAFIAHTTAAPAVDFDSTPDKRSANVGKVGVA